ncbi:MAG: tetratricopeptide repeat protein [Methylobacterium frigidaeris]
MSYRYLHEARAVRHDQAELGRVAGMALSAGDEVSSAELVELGIVTRDAGLRDAAIALLDRARDRNPADIPSRYEKAILFLHEGLHVDCLHILRRILADHPGEDRTNLLAARVLHALGDHDEATRCLDRIPLDAVHDRAEWERQIRVVNEFGLHAAKYPRSRVMAMVARLERSPSHLPVQAVAARIVEALRTRSGFSLIRCGDGEGAFVFLGNTDEARHTHLYRYNRQDRARVWFAGTVDATAQPFLGQAFRLTDAIRDADIVGMPYTDWFRHEYKLLSMTGITALTNLLRLDRSPGALSCTQLIHLELHSTKLLYEIMASQGRIGLISCHPELPRMLTDRFNYEEIDYHHAPGEKGHSHLLSAEAIAGSHWPDRYEQIMEALARPLEGRLYLVAAGVLGKFYCDRIKKSGGVAVDIGSIVDGWVGALTRPGWGHLPIG